MWTCAAVISLASSVLAVLPIEEVQRCVQESFREDGAENAFVKTGGPLDLLRGYIYYRDGLARSKRLFSPVMDISYKLRYVNGQYTFDIDNSNDSTNNSCRTTKKWRYLKEYHRALKVMYNAADGQVSISSLRALSLHYFLRQHLELGTTMKLLAAMMLLAEGVDVPLEYLQEKAAGAGGAKEKTVRKVLLRRKKGERPLFWADMFRLREKDKSGDPYRFPERADEVLNVFAYPTEAIEFFRSVGGSKLQKTEALDLAPIDEPGFLMQAYIFDFLQSYDEARMFFGAVEEVLEYVGKDDSATWGRFFTTDKDEFGKHKAAHKAIEKISKLSAALRFPFSNYRKPPTHLTVRGYNRRTGQLVEDSNMDFSDCGDIAVYSLFCCLLFDPAEGGYRLGHLTGKGYAPSEDLVEFFTRECPEPVENASHDLHQKWAKVIQDLRLTDKELDETKGGEENTILYHKEKEGVGAEIVTSVFNVMRVLAKVSGFSENRRRRLKAIIDEVQDDKLPWDEVREKVEEYVKGTLEEMSIAPVKVKCNGFTRSGDTRKEVYGTVEMTYAPLVGDQSGIVHTVQLIVDKPGHGSLELVTRKIKFKPEDLAELKQQKADCVKDGGFLSRIAADSIQRFLDKADLALIPREMIKKIENARDDVARYENISELLMNCELVVVGDKLHVLDLFVPLLKGKTWEKEGPAAGEDAPEEQAPDTQAARDQSRPEEKASEAGKAKKQRTKGDRPPEPEGNAPRPPKGGDPLAHLITNIMGSVPLGDAATRDMFLEMLRFCGDERRRLLFPKIETSEEQFAKLKFEVSGLKCSPVNVMLDYSVPNLLFRYCAEFKASCEGGYLDELKGDAIFMKGWRFRRVITTYITNKHKEGMEAVKDDLCLTGPKSGNSFCRLVPLFSLSTHGSSREGIEFVCDHWEALYEHWSNYFNIEASYYYFDVITSYVSRDYPWVPLPDTMRDALCSDPTRAVQLLKVYTWFAATERDFSALYDLIRKFYGKIGHEEVIQSLRKSIQFLDVLKLHHFDDGYRISEIKAYLAAVRRFKSRMEGFLEEISKLNASVIANLEADNKRIERAEKYLDDYFRPGDG